MITWSDNGIVLNARKHGERHYILTVLTKDHGRHKGFVSPSKEVKPLIQAATGVHCVWQSRLSEQLGTFKLEGRHSFLAEILATPLALKAMNAAAGLLEICLPERVPAPEVFEAMEYFLHSLRTDSTKPFQWLTAYCRFEIALLAETGIRLDLGRCAVTGLEEGLTHVSPRTGRAVTAGVAAPYASKLLGLPMFLRPADGPQNAAGYEEILAALTLSGYFLKAYVFDPHDLESPLGRQHFIEAIPAYNHD